jgi:hypothetical protein
MSFLNRPANDKIAARADIRQTKKSPSYNRLKHSVSLITATEVSTLIEKPNLYCNATFVKAQVLNAAQIVLFVLEVADGLQNYPVVKCL